jgi:hypothetical protein
MSLRPMSAQEVAKYDFVPQATLRCPISFFTSRGVQFHEGQDDMDEFVVAELNLDDKLPFALMRYLSTPENETTVFLPRQVPIKQIADWLRFITAAFELSQSAIGWQRSRDDTFF